MRHSTLRLCNGHDILAHVTMSPEGTPEEPEDEAIPTVPFNRDRTTQPPQPPPEAHPPLRNCTSGHDQPRNPTWHRTLGLVPAMSSVIFGGIVLLLLLALEIWLLPGLVPWTVAAIAAGLAFSATAQFALGHRGACWAQRTLRWWLGPIGSLLDPLGMG